MRFMRSLDPPREPSSPPRRLSPPDKHFLHFFCPFVVRYPYPLICDSTFNVVSRLFVSFCFLDAYFMVSFLIVPFISSQRVFGFESLFIETV